MKLLSERLDEACAGVLIAEATGNLRIVTTAVNRLLDASREAAAVLRAVEGATQADVHRHAHMGPIALVETDSLVGCRVALVPLDAAGSAEGVES